MEDESAPGSLNLFLQTLERAEPAAARGLDGDDVAGGELERRLRGHGRAVDEVPPDLTGGPHLMYVDVWQRDFTYLQDPGLVEKAVGVDTTPCAAINALIPARMRASASPKGCSRKYRYAMRT